MAIDIAGVNLGSSPTVTKHPEATPLEKELA